MALKILVVDDETFIADGIAFLIQRKNPRGIKVETAYSGEEAYEKQLSFRPDIIMSDIRMPEMDGLEMIDKIRSEDAAVRFIILSGYEEFAYAKRAMELGVRFFLTKPVDEEEMMKCIQIISDEIEKERNRWYAQSSDMNVQAAAAEKERVYENLIDKEYLEKLDEAMEHLDDEKCRWTIHKIFESLCEHSQLTLQDFGIISLNLALFGMRKIPQAMNMISDYFGKNMLAMESFSKMNSMEQFENWTVNMLVGINELVIQKHVPEKKDVISEAKEYICQNFNQNISLNDIAERFYINPYYFSQLFKKKCGQTYLNYLTEVRVNTAKRLLAETDMKLYEICIQVGYSDIKNFNKVFEKIIGEKPGNYRQKVRELK